MRNFSSIIEKGVQVSDLMQSDVFQIHLDYDEWPGTHHNDKKMIMPYTGSMFGIRDQYKTIFGKTLQKLDIQDEVNTSSPSLKLVKIKYSLNILPSIGEHVDRDNNLVK